jgi:hypothetical protein
MLEKKTDSIMKLFVKKGTSGMHEGEGYTTEEIGIKLNLCRKTTIQRIKKLILEGKLQVYLWSSVPICYL